MSDIILKAENLGKTYPFPKGVFRVFEGLELELERGVLAAVMGASGVGKTTLLNILGAIDRPTEGRVLLAGQDLFSRPEREIAEARNRKIGFVFQFYHLLPEFTALENIGVPLLIGGRPKKEAFERALEVLREVSLEDKAQSRPSQLSGGEQQRVAIARALAAEPELLLADEPTGNLDWKAGEGILRLILDLHQRRGLSSIIVTHNEKIARFCDTFFLMEDGRLKRGALPPS